MDLPRRRLLEAMRARGGLGYNEASPIDADSTAHALLFLTAEREESDRSLGEMLLQFQASDGGFSTFIRPPDSRDSSWTTSHPEVTATALLALWPLRTDPLVATAIKRAFDWAESSPGWDGCARAFWWNLTWYGRLQWVRALKRHDRAVPRELSLPQGKSRLDVTSHLDAAYLLELCLELDQMDDAALVAGSLCETQKPNGLWPTSPVLRIVDDDCFSPWSEPGRSSLVADAGLYSSATIVVALDRYCSATDQTS